MKLGSNSACILSIFLYCKETLNSCRFLSAICIADIILETALSSTLIIYLVWDRNGGITIPSVLCPVLGANQTVAFKTLKQSFGFVYNYRVITTQGVTDWSTSRLIHVRVMLICVQMLSFNLTISVCQGMSWTAWTYAVLWTRRWPVL